MEAELDQGGGGHWIPLSDLMTGMMMVFLLVAVAFMLKVDEVAKVSTTIVTDYEAARSDLFRALQEEFKEDLKRWNADLLGDLTIRFKDPNVLFDTGSAHVKDGFKQVLAEFLPRYVRILRSPKWSDEIREVRIEGHTSKVWTKARDTREAYFRNMALSQERTRSALEYIISLPPLYDDLDWLIAHVTANGLSSSRPLKIDDKEVDDLRNQRVEFRIVTNAEKKIDQLIERAKAQ
jgi:outer membrane protein OmpA-like peptidoglycan-associated protein